MCHAPPHPRLTKKDWQAAFGLHHSLTPVREVPPPSERNESSLSVITVQGQQKATRKTEQLSNLKEGYATSNRASVLITDVCEIPRTEVRVQ